jgi:hypothetical protein
MQCDAGGGNFLRTNNFSRRNAPTPTLPRMREREFTVRVARVIIPSRSAIIPLVEAELPPDTVDGQPWQPQAEDPPSR